MSVTPRAGHGIAGYVKRTDQFTVIGGRPVMNANVWPVYADGGSPLVGHFYPCRGFVALADDEGTITNGCSSALNRAIDLEAVTVLGVGLGPSDNPDTVRTP